MSRKKKKLPSSKFKPIKIYQKIPTFPIKSLQKVLVKLTFPLIIILHNDPESEKILDQDTHYTFKEAQSNKKKHK